MFIIHYEEKTCNQLESEETNEGCKLLPAGPRTPGLAPHVAN